LSNIVPVPQDFDIELNVLSAGFYDSASLQQICFALNSEDFFTTLSQLFFTVYQTCFDSAIPVNEATIRNQLKLLEKHSKESEEFLFRIITCEPQVQSLEYFINNLKEKTSRRYLLNASKRISNLSLSNIKLPEVLDETEKLIFEITQKSAKKTFLKISDVLNESFDRIEKLSETGTGLRGIPTGFREIDECLSGLQSGDLVIIAARPSVGKSSLGFAVARHAAVDRNYSVGIFSLEMSADQVSDRFLSIEGEIDLGKIRSGRLEDEDYANLAEAIGKLSEAKIFIEDSSISGILDIKAKARRAKSEYNLDLIIIDYLQLIEGDKRENRAQEVSEISRQLKGLARELNVPVVALSQLSRAVENRPNKKPILSDLRESGSIEQDADVVMFIHRADVYARMEDAEAATTAEVIVAKHRNGPTGVYKLGWVAEYATFIDSGG
jgi:replicative DNA helicase